jgi:hypothetical protein
MSNARQVLRHRPNLRGPVVGGTTVRGAGLVAVTMAAALVAAGCATVPTTTSTVTTPSATTGPSRVGPLALGVNLASWDALYTGAGVSPINGLFEAAGLRLLRYPGGDFADQYDWSSDTDTSTCTGAATTACSRTDPLPFDLLSAEAHGAGASSFVTVNYGSGTPAEAGAWVTHAKSGPNSAVALWEVGNETYSCYETNQHLAGPPTYVRGYTPGGHVCPTTGVMARSYTANALPYLQAMRKADPDARIGVPWAFSGAVADGAGVSDADTWNTDVLRALRPEISFVDAHWYPFDKTAGVSDEQILASVRRIPAAADHLRSTLRRDAPRTTFVVGETNISERPTTNDFRPVSALFAAATSLEWLSAGAESVDWWNLNNFGSPASGDFGLVSSGNQETGPAGTPLPPYYGYELASMLTSTGSRLRAVAVAPSSVLGFESDLRGRRSVLLVNSAPKPQPISAGWFRPGLEIQTETYSAATSTDAEPIVGSTVSSTTGSATTVSLPAESIVVLSGDPR